VRSAYFLILVAAIPALAQAAGPPCNLRTFNGVYSLLVTGQVINEPSVPVPPGPVSRVGRAISDGNGNVKFQQRGSYNGVPSDESATGTYTISSDCVATFIINAPPPVSFPVTFQGPILASGDSLTIMQIDPGGTTVKVNSRRVQNSCNFEDLKGTYALDMKGFIPKHTIFFLPSPPFPPGLPPLDIGNDAIQGDYLELGVLTFEPPTGNDLVAGKPGILKGATTASFNGNLDRETWSGTYTIDKDCTVNASFSKHAGAAGILNFSWWGVLADQGRDLRIVQQPLTLGAMDGDAYLSANK
jgi:hypothetical protein